MGREMPSDAESRGPSLPADLDQRIDLTVKQTMALTGHGKPTVMKKIMDRVYWARRGPRNQWLVAKESMLSDREAEYAKPLQKQSIWPSGET